MSPSHFFQKISLTLAWAALAALPAHAIVRLDSSFGVFDADYIALGANYTSVGFVSGPSSGGGVLVTSNWVLTAAHVATNQIVNSSHFIIDGQTFTIDAKIINPGYTSNPINNDIALLHLSNSVTTVTPATLYTGSNETGMEAVWVGLGQTGTGLTGQNGTGVGTKRGATNMVDVYAYASNTPTPGIYFSSNSTLGTFIVADFDDNTLGNNTLLTYGSLPLVTSLEGGLASTDSGGGVFADFGSGPVLIGINDFNSPGNNGSATQYSALSAATRVSQYSGWITSQIPEPYVSGLMGALVGLAALTWRRRRSRMRG